MRFLDPHQVPDLKREARSQLHTIHTSLQLPRRLKPHVWRTGPN